VQRSEDGCDMRKFRSVNDRKTASSESVGGQLFETYS